MVNDVLVVNFIDIEAEEDYRRVGAAMKVLLEKTPLRGSSKHQAHKLQRSPKHQSPRPSRYQRGLTKKLDFLQGENSYLRQGRMKKYFLILATFLMCHRSIAEIIPQEFQSV